MKRAYIVIGIVVVLLIAGAVWFFTRSAGTAAGAEVRVFIDVTDKDSGRMSAATIIKVATNGEDITQPMRIQTEPLSPFHNNMRQSFYMPGESLLFGNAHRRQRAMNVFSRQVDTALQVLYNGQSDKNRSTIFEQILNSANELSAVSMKCKIIIAQTDLAENTPMWSSYRNTDIQLLRKHPAEVERLLLQGAAVKNLHDVTMYIVHVPVSQSDDDRYTIMSKFYKTFFEKYGAKVYIGSNLFTH
jgi:hypothetical protein